MKCDVLTLDNKKAGSIDLADGVFGSEVRKDIISRMVNWQLARRRSGNHKTKNVSEIQGYDGQAMEPKRHWPSPCRYSSRYPVSWRFDGFRSDRSRS